MKQIINRVFLGCFFPILLLGAQTTPTTAPDAPLPVVVGTGQGSGPVSNLDRERSDHYDTPDDHPIVEYPTDVSPLPLSTHWQRDLDPIPAKQSQAVVVGTVISGRTFLSTHRANLITAYRIHVSEVLKSTYPDLSDLEVERWGGKIVFSSGKRETYSWYQQGQLLTNHQYVFFLSSEGKPGNYHVLTAFEVRDGKIHPVDGLNTEPLASPSMFDKYEGVDVNTFLAQVKEALAAR